MPFVAFVKPTRPLSNINYCFTLNNSSLYRVIRVDQLCQYMPSLQGSMTGFASEATLNNLTQQHIQTRLSQPVRHRQILNNTTTKTIIKRFTIFKIPHFYFNISNLTGFSSDSSCLHNICLNIHYLETMDFPLQKFSFHFK